MGLTDALRAAGFKPEASTDGEWTPYKGTYKAKCEALRLEKDDEGNEYIQEELRIVETLAGDASRSSKFADFRSRYYLTGEKAEANVKKLINNYFTWGVEFDTSSDDALKASLEQAIGAEGYVRAWGWKPQDSDTERQSYVFNKEKVALKRKDKSASPF